MSTIAERLGLGELMAADKAARRAIVARWALQRPGGGPLWCHERGGTGKATYATEGNAQHALEEFEAMPRAVPGRVYPHRGHWHITTMAL